MEQSKTQAKETVMKVDPKKQRKSFAVLQQEKQDALPLDRLRAILDYNPETGVFVWKQTMNRAVKVGQIAGSISPASPYVQLRKRSRIDRARKRDGAISTPATFAK